MGKGRSIHCSALDWFVLIRTVSGEKVVGGFATMLLDSRCIIQSVKAFIPIYLFFSALG